jgi:chlorophyll synthase
VAVGIVLAGPITCGMSQAANDWCDRHVDAVNEPQRPIPSGRVPGRWGLYVALAMSALALAVGGTLGPWGFGATVLAVVSAWAYSAEPVRLKRSGWWGPGLVALCYEGLPWFTGAAVMAAGAPRFEVVVMAGLYAFGAHGIMTLNDFKALEGDRQHGVRSLPVVLGPEVAARIACTTMAMAQALVIALLFVFGRPGHALAVLALLLAQVAAMRVLFRDPKGRAPWYNGTGVVLYVAGMMVTAFAVRGLP